jgi:hypothetical protein
MPTGRGSGGNFSRDPAGARGAGEDRRLLAAPGLVEASIFTFTGAWNVSLQALVFLFLAQRFVVAALAAGTVKG